MQEDIQNLVMMLEIYCPTSDCPPLNYKEWRSIIGHYSIRYGISLKKVKEYVELLENVGVVTIISNDELDIDDPFSYKIDCKQCPKFWDDKCQDTSSGNNLRQ